MEGRPGMHRSKNPIKQARLTPPPPLTAIANAVRHQNPSISFHFLLDYYAVICQTNTVFWPIYNLLICVSASTIKT